MVKFKLPGDDKTAHRIEGHSYMGGVVYDNNVIRLPLEALGLDKFIIDKPISAPKPVKVIEPVKVVKNKKIIK